MNKQGRKKKIPKPNVIKSLPVYLCKRWSSGVVGVVYSPFVPAQHYRSWNPFLVQSGGRGGSEGPSEGFGGNGSGPFWVTVREHLDAAVFQRSKWRRCAAARVPGFFHFAGEQCFNNTSDIPASCLSPRLELILHLSTSQSEVSKPVLI